MEGQKNTFILWAAFLGIGATGYVFEWIWFTQIFHNQFTHYLNLIIQYVGLNNSFFLIFHFFFVLSLCAFNFLSPSKKLYRKLKGDNYYQWFIYAFITNSLMILGLINVFVYDVIIFPFIFLSNIFITAAAFSFRSGHIKDDESIFGISDIKSDFYFDFETKDGLLTFHKPNHNFLFEAKPGMGKSNILKQAIVQGCERGYPMLIYDFKGDPTKGDEPELSNIAFTAWSDAKRKHGDDFKLKFGFLNFVDLSKTNRINFLNDRYIESESDIKNISKSLMKSIKGKDAKEDFWAQYGEQMVEGCILYLCRHHSKDGFNTMPHAIALLNSDYNSLFSFLSQDIDIKHRMASLMAAWEKNAENQLAGAMASGQVPFSVLLSKEIFWVLSEDNFSLDVNNRNEPLLLCVANAVRRQNAITPVLTALFETAMQEMNNSGKLPSALLLDEIATLRLNGLGTFLATARGRMVATFLLIQDFSQFKRDYQADIAQSLRSNCGNVLIGGCGIETAETYAKFFGQTKVVRTSYQTGESDKSDTETDSIQMENILQARDIEGQKIGEIIGSVADGSPRYFNTRFSEFQMNVREIPPFAYPYTIFHEDGSINHSASKKLLDVEVEANYIKIWADITDLLRPFSDNPGDLSNNPEVEKVDEI